MNEKRIQDMAEGLRQIKALPDPIGNHFRLDSSQRFASGTAQGTHGSCGIIRRLAQCNSDAIGLCIKTANAVVLKGSEAIHSNKAIAEAMSEAAYKAGIPNGAIQLIEDTDRSSVIELMQLSGIIDVLIPREGRSY